MFKYFFIIFCFAACVTSKKLTDKYDVVRFKEKIPYENKSYVQDYLLNVPVGGRLKKISTGDYYMEYRILYPDSSMIYIMNDKWGGSRLNYQNRLENNIKAISKKKENDSLYLGGNQKNGKYWKENYINEMVVGYINVLPDNKNKFDSALLSLRKNE